MCDIVCSTFMSLLVFYVTCNDISATIFQSYMWRHIYLPSGSQRHRLFVGFFNVPVRHRHGPTLFIRWFRHRPIKSPFTTRWGYGGRILDLNPRPAQRHMQGYIFFSYICDRCAGDWRSRTYGRAPNTIDISLGSFTCPSKHQFNGYSERPSHINRLLRRAWRNGGPPKKATWQHKNATINFDYATIADRLWTVRWGNDRHPSDVIKPVYGV